MSDDQLDLARAAYARMAWGDAAARYAAADDLAPLAPEDLERAARAAQLLGRTAESSALWQRAVHDCERTGDLDRGARNAVELGMELMQRGDHAQAGGWLARGRRLFDEAGRESAVAGYLLISIALPALYAGDAATAESGFVEALEIGKRFGERDLIALGRLGLGNTLVALGRRDEGLALLDEAMVSATAGEISPLITGVVYCATIEACHALLDLRRAREWTEALSRWCDAQPDLMAFRGQCLTHRSQIMTVRGEWSDALDEVQRACDRLLKPPPQPAVGDALYQKAELHYLRGDFDSAEAAFRAATEWGREPQPGLALLRLAQGQPDVAEAAIRRVLGETHQPVDRARLLAASVDIMLAVDDVGGARSAAGELAEIAAEFGAPALDATAAYAAGAVALADGDAHRAMGDLRRAWTLSCDLDMPREAARARVLIGLACRELGDDDTAAMELDMARQALAQLGAAPDLARLDAIATQRTPAAAASGLTGREVEVLELISAGKTNRQIAEALFISEKTVARHVSNIFTKLAVSSRSAATAYAYRHGLA